MHGRWKERYSIQSMQVCQRLHIFTLMFWRAVRFGLQRHLIDYHYLYSTDMDVIQISKSGITMILQIFS